MKVSVALAAYNGERYIAEQLRSILAQIGVDDEVIISDDNPSGKTYSAIKDIISNDPRVVYLEGPSRGVIKNFEFAIGKCSGDIIFLSDQDDVWLDGKVDAVRREFENGASLVLHDAIVTDGELNTICQSFFGANRSRPGYIANIVKNSYMGCCMAISSDLKSYVLPFPGDIPMHDQYIGLVAEKLGKKVSFLEKPYILYRKHGDNVTGGKTRLSDKIKWRINIIKRTISL